MEQKASNKRQPKNSSSIHRFKIEPNPLPEQVHFLYIQHFPGMMAQPPPPPLPDAKPGLMAAIHLVDLQHSPAQPPNPLGW